MTALPDAFCKLPLAHRGLHDGNLSCPENSRAAVDAALCHGYGIELDVQLSADGQAMVFHDEDLDRLTAETGPVRLRPAAELQAIRLAGTGETIPTLADILALVAGRVPLLIEIKDQDGQLGPDVGALEEAVARALQGYEGPVAVMSFNPHSVEAFGRAAPDVPRGLVTSAYRPADWHVPVETCERLRAIPDFDRSGASFISHEADDLGNPRVAELRAAGVPVLCWTIRSPVEEARARRVACSVTFERYMAALPG